MRRKVVSALAVGLVFYALSDILLWQRIFEARELNQYDAQYQIGHSAVLVGMVVTGMVLLYESGLWAIWCGLAFYTLAFSGLEDVLYYLLDGRGIPARCPWLDENRVILFKPVTGSSLVLSAVVWISLWPRAYCSSRWSDPR